MTCLMGAEMQECTMFRNCCSKVFLKCCSLHKLKPHLMWLTCTVYMSLVCVHTQNILHLLAFKPSDL